MARSVALAVDLGASGGRVLSGAFDGRILELEELHRFDNQPLPFGGRLVWDLPLLWREVVAGLRLLGLVVSQRHVDVFVHKLLQPHAIRLSNWLRLVLAKASTSGT